MVTEQNFVQRIAMKAVIVDDRGRVLILREANTYAEGTNIGKYGLPGGRINPGEPFLKGLAREVQEETGLDVEVRHPVYVGEWFPVIKGVSNQIVAVFIECKTVTTEVRLSEEHDDFRWIVPEEVSSYLFMPPDDTVIRTYAAQRT